MNHCVLKQHSWETTESTYKVYLCDSSPALDFKLNFENVVENQCTI